MEVLFDFQACRGCLAPNTNGTFTSLFENPENAVRFDAIAEASIADDKDEFAALICDSCFDEMTQAFELRRNLRFLEKISFETRRVKNNLQDVGSSIDKSSRKSVEDVDESNKSMSNKAQEELPRLREFHVRIERLEDVNESSDQSDDSNVESKPANASKLSKVKAKELTSNIDYGCHKRQVQDGQMSNLADENNVAQPNKLINYNELKPKVPHKSIKCLICQKMFTRKDILKLHIQIVHKKIKKFVCKVCEFKFGYKGDLKRHIQAVHNKIKNFKCDLCDFKSSMKGNLQSHIACHIKNPNFKPRLYDTSNSDRPFKCSVVNCGKFFKTKWNLDQHEKTHSDSRPELSAKMVASKTDHQKVPDVQSSRVTDVANEANALQPSDLNKKNELTPKLPHKSNKCQICQRSCVNKSKLKRHIDQVHLNIKKFVCKVCGFKFGQKGSLKQHIKAVHDKIKNFKCDLCGFKLSLKNNLQKHIHCHVRNPNYKPYDTSNPNRPFKCEIENCEKFFKTKGQLIGHKKTHSDFRPFICTTCCKGFKAEKHLKRHQKDVVCGEKSQPTSQTPFD